MKRVILLLTLFICCFIGRAQSTHYPTYDKNGMPVKSNGKVKILNQVQDDNKAAKGSIDKRRKSGMLINAGSYEVKGNTIELHKRTSSGMSKPDKQLRIKPNGNVEILQRDNSGLLRNR